MYIHKKPPRNPECNTSRVAQPDSSGLSQTQAGSARLKRAQPDSSGLSQTQAGSGRLSWARPWIRKPRLGLVGSEWSILASATLYTNSGKVHQVPTIIGGLATEQGK